MSIPEPHELLADYIARNICKRLEEGIPLKMAIKELADTYHSVHEGQLELEKELAENRKMIMGER